METPKVFESEYKFCLILWENEPIKSGNLVKLCKERLGWKSTTTYTVIKRLSERGVIKNENTIVSSIVSKEQIQWRKHLKVLCQHLFLHLEDMKSCLRKKLRT